LQFANQRQYDCILGIDKMAFIPGEKIDSCTNFVVGSSTIPNSHGNCYTLS